MSDRSFLARQCRHPAAPLAVAAVELNAGMSDTELGGRYLLGGVLGRGGVAEVYRARDRVLDRDVAVKLLRESVDDSDRARFLGEARVLAQLSHVGLVTVLDAGTTGDRPYLVMELVEGPTLAAVLRDGPLPLDRVADVGAQVAGALAYAHEQGVVHRDVKPANVLLGDRGFVKLADFGIARLIGDTVRHTRTGTSIGTPAYLAPEQVTGSAVGPPADVYALGLTLLEAATGERAFPGTPTEAAMARLHRPPAIPADLPATWRSLVAAMTATDPEARPTAAAAAEQLAGLTVVPDQSGTRVLPVMPPGPAVSDDALTEPMSVAGASGGTAVAVPAAAPTSAAGGWLDRLRGLSTSTKAMLLLAVLLAVLLLAAVVATGGGTEPADEMPGPTRSPSSEPVTTATSSSDSDPTSEQTTSEPDGGSGDGEQPGKGEDKEEDKGRKDKDKGKDEGKDEGKGKG